jgi:hypothetical protein
MRNTLAWINAAALAANGLFMLADPASWYAAVPGVTATGPLNPHFVRDIGCAYIVVGVSLAAFAIDARYRAAALAAGTFLTLHALVHVWDAASERESLHQFVNDLPAVFAPPVITLWLALPSVIFAKEKAHVEMDDPAAHRRL